jgi:hypothetical protein
MVFEARAPFGPSSLGDAVVYWAREPRELTPVDDLRDDRRQDVRLTNPGAPPVSTPRACHATGVSAS